MTDAAAHPTGTNALPDRTAVSLGIGVAVSLVLHAGLAWSLGVVPGRSGEDARPVPVVQQPPEAPEEEADPLRLGMDIPENASIAWLGVLENPVEAESPESEVDQAALAPVIGEEPSPDVAAPPIEPERPPVEPVEPAPEVTDPPPPPALPTEPLPPVPEPPAPVVPEPLRVPVEEGPPEILPELVPTEPPELTEPIEPADPVEPTDPVEPAEQLEPTDQAEPGDPGVMGPPAPEASERDPADASPPALPPQPARPTERPPTPEGAPGELDERASDAAMRRTARELPVERLGRPLQASGDLQLTTVRPTWSLQVRNAYSPRRNPFVEIRFGADGRVKLARFVPLPDGTRGSGYEEVDQPLLNAVYRWRATGKAIEALDAGDPESTHEIVMRFLLVPSVPGEGDGE